MYVTRCETCMDIEDKKKNGERCYWNTKTENQAEMIRSIHLSNHGLHKVEVKEIA